VRLFGGYGYMVEYVEYPMARTYAASRVNKTYGGTSDIMTEIVSRSL
jgi:acyl-CoA dehydrogenase